MQRDAKLHAAQSEILSIATATLVEQGASIDCDARAAKGDSSPPARRPIGEVDFLTTVEAKLRAIDGPLQEILAKASARLAC